MNAFQSRDQNDQPKKAGVPLSFRTPHFFDRHPLPTLAHTLSGRGSESNVKDW
jgi:hypothetical protein